MRKWKKEYYLEVYSKDGASADTELKAGLKDLGIKVAFVKKSKVYLFRGFLGGSSKGILRRIATELLTDSVSEDFTLKRKREKGANITVFMKPGVLDIEGKSVLEAIGIMGIKGLREVLSGRKYVITAKNSLSVERSRFLAEKLLFNPIIEDAEIKNR